MVLEKREVQRWALLAVACFLAACKSSPATAPEPAHAGTSAPSPTATASGTDSPVSIVEAAVVVSECPEAKGMNERSAKDAIRKLVDPCAMVPGGSAHFAATLMPDGRIQLAAPSGDPAEGIVPTCVLENKLAHKVLLRHPCKFDVKLEERLPAGAKGAAPAHS